MKNSLLIVFEMLLVCILIMICCCGCINTKLNMPSKAIIESKLDSNSEQFETIVKYLLEQQYDWCSLNEKLGSGVLTSNHERLTPPKAVQTAIKDLGMIGCKSIEMDRSYNSIIFELWVASLGDLNCGVLYRIDDSSEIEAEYMTELVPLENGNGKWFYFVSDYDTYRANSADE